MQLLLIDRIRENGELLGKRLGAVGFRARHCETVREALNCSDKDAFAAVLVDHGRQIEAPASLVEPLRSGGITQPLLVLSARDEWREKVACLDAGADDFLVKPVRSEEIAARLRALIRRSAGAPTDRIVFGDIDLDLRMECAWKAGTCLNLTRNEFRLMRLLLLSPERALDKDRIRQTLWGLDATVSNNAIEVQVARLRRKLGEGSIQTSRGQGYRLVAADKPVDDDEVPPRSRCLGPKSDSCCD